MQRLEEARGGERNHGGERRHQARGRRAAVAVGRHLVRLADGRDSLLGGIDLNAAALELVEAAAVGALAVADAINRHAVVRGALVERVRALGDLVILRHRARRAISGGVLRKRSGDHCR